MTTSAILRLENITLKFSPKAVPVIAGVTLTLASGEVLGLLGPSGCGKTTLLRIIAGFESPQTGTVEIAGRVVANKSTWIPPEQRHVGMLFQDYALFPHLSVRENIAFGLQSTKMSDRQQRVAELLDLVRLSGLEKRYPHELSGGQQQRVALARALAPQPKLLLLDEPLSNLDAQVRLSLREEVLEILKTQQISAIFVTHDQQEALAIADQVAVMQQGKLEQLGTPEAIYHQPASRFVAEFVTQANFLPARRRGNLWETEIGCFAIKEQNSNNGIHSLSSQNGYNSKVSVYSLHTDTDNGDVMIPEEDIILQPVKDGAAMIKTRRFLGSEYRYCLRTASGKKLYARTPSTISLSVGTRVKLSVIGPLRFFPYT
ncbi:ABC transporter ATP-binding protein [Halotia branconii]|uniref:ABC-type quaternary amine transporter n=1 Tax=Halotia branconii CENA392 TaxID=1539056 RepID=A0AAJ6NX13_9CYAN|nr:ABC transporter ATP-binding protein [Halotia branconii]WGV28192.1 ABC transporter ATP-binding protein [Halotia branconii CENA392]